MRAKIPEGVRFAAAGVLVHLLCRSCRRKLRSPLTRIPMRARIPEGVRFAAARQRALARVGRPVARALIGASRPKTAWELATLGCRAQGTQRALGRSLGVTVRRIPSAHSSSRSAGALRRRLAVGLLVLASLVLISLSFRSGEGRPAVRRAVRRCHRAPPLRRGRRAGGAALPRRLRVDGQPARRPLGGRGATRGGPGPPAARDPERVRAPGERVPPPPSRLPRRTALPRRLRAGRGRGGEHGRQGRSRRRSSSRPARATASASTIPS